MAERGGPSPDDSDEACETPESPSLVPADDVVDEAERLTRQARNAVDENARQAYQDERKRLLAEHGYRARVREDDRDVLVLYPGEWVEDGVVKPGRVEDVDRGIERPLEGAGDTDDWGALDEHNRAIAATVEDRFGSVHGENVRELAKFMSNHYCKPIEDATGGELQEFVDEYFPRNAWPTDEQSKRVGESVERAFDCLDVSCPF